MATKQQWQALLWKVMKDGQIHSLRVSSQKRNNQLWLCLSLSLSLSLIMHIQDFATMLQIRANNIGCRRCRRITPKLQSFLRIIVLQLLAAISSLSFLPPHRCSPFLPGSFYCSLNIVSDTWDHPLFSSLLPALPFLSFVLPKTKLIWCSSSYSKKVYEGHVDFLIPIFIVTTARGIGPVGAYWLSGGIFWVWIRLARLVHTPNHPNRPILIKPIFTSIEPVKIHIFHCHFLVHWWTCKPEKP